MDSEHRAARHPIGVVAERTGLSPDLLRVWERRYRVVEPSRSLDGQRAYSDLDVERLRLLRSATRAGRSIRRVARLTTDELAGLVREDEAARQQASRDAENAIVELGGADLDRALALARGPNTLHLEIFLRRAIVTFGIPAFLDRLAAPLLLRVAEDSDGGSFTAAQERVATATIQHVLEGAIQFLVTPPDAPTLLLTTPIAEQQVTDSVLAAAAAAADGWRVINLGSDLPAVEIAAAASTVGARVVRLSIVSDADPPRLLEELHTLRSLLPGSVPLVAGGPHAGTLATELGAVGVHVAGDFSALRSTLRAALHTNGGSLS